MGIFDFFKSKKPAEQPEKISFENTGKWLEDKDKSLRENENKTISKIVEKLDEFYVSLEEKLKILEGVDVEAKKEHGRIKLLVNQGLEKYINSVNVLPKDLKAIKKENLEKFVSEISRIFLFFEKTSYKFYERATYLVGEEIAAVRNEIRRFYNGLMEMFEDDSLIKNLKKVMEVRNKLNDFEKIERNIKEFERDIETNNLKVEKAKKKVEKLMKGIENIKNSSEYASNLKTGEEIKALKVGLDKEVIKLKNIIDFKKLTGIVHTNEREFGIVKSHNSNFSSEFYQDSGKRILKLLEDSNMKSAIIDSQVSLIEKKNFELDELSGRAESDSTIEKLNEVRKIEIEIDGIETEKVRAKRRLAEFGLKLKRLKNEVTRLVEKV